MKRLEVYRLHKRAEVKVIVGEKTYVHHFVAPAVSGYSEKDIEKILENAAAHLETKFPMFEFRMVERGPNKFTFIQDGVKEHTESAWPGLKKALGLEGDDDVQKIAGETLRPDTGSASGSGTDSEGCDDTERSTDAGTKGADAGTDTGNSTEGILPTSDPVAGRDNNLRVEGAQDSSAPSDEHPVGGDVSDGEAGRSSDGVPGRHE